MSYKYSPSANAFFAPEHSSVPVPADAVDITAEQHAALMSELASGKELSADGNGAPIAVPRVPRTTPPAI